MKRSWRELADLLFSRECDGCGAPLTGDGETLYCWDCLAKVAWLRMPWCACCGDPVEGTVPAEFRCAWCARKRPAYDWARSAARFEGVVAESLKRLKYHGGVWTADGLGEMLHRTWRTCAPGGVPPEADCVAAVPLFRVRMRERSYNQSALLGAALAERLGVPFREPLRRVRDTPTQTKLSARERAANMAGAFAVRRWRKGSVAGKRIVLVDDVMTTGATVNECAKALKAAGAAAVYVLTVARGIG